MIIIEKHFIEIGAQWIHGTVGNPVFDIAESLDLVDLTKGVKNKILLNY